MANIKVDANKIKRVARILRKEKYGKRSITFSMKFLSWYEIYGKNI